MKTVLLLFFFLTSTVVAAEKPGAGGDALARGKYLVEGVAMCVECHTPRDSQGMLLAERYLEGAPIPVKAPPYPGIRWAVRAPVIAGLPGYTEEEGLRLLMKGITREGRRPDPPMPAFRFNRADAEAIVAYLRSLR